MMDQFIHKIRALPRDLVTLFGACSLFFILFCLLASHVTTDEYCDYVVDKEKNFIRYKDIAEGCDPFWTDFESFPYHFEVSINLLRPQSANTLFAYKSTSTNVTAPIDAIGVNTPVKWALGFSVGAGYEFFHYDWDFLAKYSLFTTTEKGSTSTPLIGAVIPSLGLGLLDHTVGNATSVLGFTWNNLEILLDKKFHFRENLLLFTSLGLETTWLSYSQKATYTGGTYLGPQSAVVKRTSHLFGLGPEAGLKSNWLFADNFYLKAATTGSLQFIYQDTYYVEKSALPGYNALFFKDNENFIAPTLSLSLGLGFAQYFACDTRFISFELLYEQRTFFQQNQLLNVLPAANPRFTHATSDLSLQGFLFKIDLRY